MFRDLPQYEQHRPAGGWVLTIPDHWGWEPARTLFAERKVLGCIDEELLSVTIGRGVIRQEVLLAASSKKDSSNLDKSKYKLVEPGDLVYNKMRAWQGAAGGSRYRGIVSPAYIVMRPRDGLMEYFHHLLRTPMFATEAERWSYGITSDQWSLRPEHFKMIRFPVPPAEEQAAIVKYLAHANARIDNAIAAKRRLISLLEEQQRVVVHEAINRVDAAKVPIKRALQSMTAGLWGASPEESGEPPIWCVRVADFDYVHNTVTSAPKTLRAVNEKDANRKSLRQGDLLLEGSGGGDKTSVGRVVLFDHEAPAVCSNFLQRLRPREGVHSGYLSHVLRDLHSTGSVRTYIKQTTGIQNLDLEAYRSILIPMPDMDSQAVICREIEESLAENDVLIDRVNHEIDLIQEFRTRLVSDVVAGQVDVRAIAETLPDAPEAVTVTGDLESELIDVEGETEVEA